MGAMLAGRLLATVLAAGWAMQTLPNAPAPPVTHSGRACACAAPRAVVPPASASGSTVRRGFRLPRGRCLENPRYRPHIIYARARKCTLACTHHLAVPVRMHARPICLQKGTWESCG